MELMRSHLGGYYCQYGETLIKAQDWGQIKLTCLKMWAFFAISSQVAFNALFMRVFHPVVLLVLYIPVATVNFYFSPSEQTAFARIRETILSPMNLLAAFRSSFFGFGQWDPFAEMEQGHQPALAHCAAQLLRNITMLVLMCIDFPTAPIRPMGLGVVRSELLVPVKYCIGDPTEGLQEMVQTLHNFNFTSAEHWHSAYTYGAQQIFSQTAFSSSAYKALLQLMAMIGLPLYMVGMMWLLISRYFRTGEACVELNSELERLYVAVATCLENELVSDGQTAE